MSDDYFFDDDIILDDQTLAVLDSEEQKFLSQAPPPAKRQKTDKGWKPVAIQGRAPVDEDLPEISVHGDGSYVFRGPPKVGGSTGTVVAAATFKPPIPHQRVASVPVASRVPTHTRPPEPPGRPRDPAPQPAIHTRVQAPPRREPPPSAPSEVLQAQGEALRKQIEEVCKVHIVRSSTPFIIFAASKGE